MLATIFDYFQTAWKMSAAPIFTIFVVIAMLLFLPDEIAKILHYIEFREQHKTSLGPILLFCGALLLAKFLTWIASFFWGWIRQRKREKYLHQLTEHEKGYLQQFIFHRKTVVNASLEDGVMSSLLRQGIVARPSTMGNVLDGFEFVLEPWARNYLSKNPSLLDGGNGRPLTPRERMFGRRS